ncbi:ABC transporter substrate-binding protein [Bradyrhizobium sp. Pear77]|uniref:ABC transporter substrate-binding protein n=1 Tax=Bradyrhizobium TaxID=374 RepID=UPI001E4AE798|nr:MULTISPECIES: ABC transporter substrate-binding protein [Bradyrhizobium]MCC8953247.1 ABC transporter substrate-binding protein [Bradyrhizobium altum]MCC8965028.1 ABC transporter substrate-binding protein [Bradyrhizobium oropedii]
MRMKKIVFTAIAAFGLVVVCSASQAQQADKVYRVGMLSNWGPGPVFDALKGELARLGYVEGKNIIFEARFPEGQLDRLPGFAVELVNLGVDVIATYGGPSTNAAWKASKTVPIVAAIVADPVAVGFAATLERPGGNITGITSDDPSLGSRQLEILKQLIPNLARVAILSDSDIPGADASGLAPVERNKVAAARAAGVTPQVLKVHGPTPDLDAAFKAMASEGAEALIVLEVPVTIPVRKRIAELAAAHRMPAIFWGGASDAGGLITYGTSFTDTFAGVPSVVDKILKGAKPADVPFELITRREFVVNLKTAQALGLTIPVDLLKRADHVIE